VRARPRWKALAPAVATEGSGAALDRAEDELDAHLCAYVAAHLWAHGHARNRIVGDTETGYIVVPVTEELADCLDRSPAR
jgi:predicted RNase H-like nuclease